MSKLLILDNSADLLYALEIFFERKEYKVKTLLTAFNLISEVKSLNPDVLMLDVVLNGDDGREICEMIRNDDETKHIGILLTSASRSMLQDYKRYQADDCIEKPFDLNKLEEKIKSVLAWMPSIN